MPRLIVHRPLPHPQPRRPYRRGLERPPRARTDPLWDFFDGVRRPPPAAPLVAA